MTRIAGIVCLNEDYSHREHSHDVKRMCSLQNHFGSNDERVESNGPISFGHNQPGLIRIINPIRKTKEEKPQNYLIVLDGKIFNLNEICKKLQKRGYKTQYQTDSEILLYAFIEFGEKLFKKIKGPFALAIYDPENQITFLVRDTFGEKPLYYSVINGLFYFASELSPLIQICPDIRLNKKSLIEWSLYRNLETPCTLFENIWSLPPGHFIKINKGCFEVKAHASCLDFIDRATYERFQRAKEQDVVDELEATLFECVNECLGVNGTTGTFCSGGLDSSLITAMASRSIHELVAFHSSSTDNRTTNELHYAEKVTNLLGVSLISCPIDKEIFCQEIFNVIYQNGMPLTHIHLVAFAQIIKMAKEMGKEILLTGDASDGQFGGLWHRHRRQRQLLLLKRLFIRLPKKIRNAMVLTAYLNNGMPFTTVGLEALIPNVVQSIDGYARTGWRMRLEKAYEFVSKPDDRLLLTTMAEDFMDSWDIDRADRIGMARGVDCRFPFAHPKLVSLSFNLPVKYRFRAHTDKWLLKKIASRFLPSKIVYCKKRPWDFPWQKYLAPFSKYSFFRNGFCQNAFGFSDFITRDLVSSWDKNIQVFYNLVNLEIWGRIYINQETPDQVRAKIIRKG